MTAGFGWLMNECGVRTEVLIDGWAKPCRSNGSENKGHYPRSTRSSSSARFISIMVTFYSCSCFATFELLSSQWPWSKLISSYYGRCGSELTRGLKLVTGGQHFIWASCTFGSARCLSTELNQHKWFWSQTKWLISAVCAGLLSLAVTSDQQQNEEQWDFPPSPC